MLEPALLTIINIGFRSTNYWVISVSTSRVLRPVYPGLAELAENLTGLSYLARPDKAKRELGWNPRSGEEGIKETLENKGTQRN